MLYLDLFIGNVYGLLQIKKVKAIELFLKRTKRLKYVLLNKPKFNLLKLILFEIFWVKMSVLYVYFVSNEFKL